MVQLFVGRFVSQVFIIGLGVLIKQSPSLCDRIVGRGSGDIACRCGSTATMVRTSFGNHLWWVVHLLVGHGHGYLHRVKVLQIWVSGHGVISIDRDVKLWGHHWPMHLTLHGHELGLMEWQALFRAGVAQCIRCAHADVANRAGAERAGLGSVAGARSLSRAVIVGKALPGAQTCMDVLEARPS